MRKDLRTLSDRGMSVRDIGRYTVPTPELNKTDCSVEGLLASSNYKGFPIVSSDGGLSLVGYIERSEIRYVLGGFGASVTLPNSN